MDIRNPIPSNGGDWLAKFGESWKRQISELTVKFGTDLEEVHMPMEHPTDVPILYVKVTQVLPVLQHLKEAPGCEYGFLSDITATDEETDPRFVVVYNLFSHVHRSRIRVKVRVKEGQEVPTAISLWKGANWAEREVFDMYGVRFAGHPDLRRILMDSRWVGHPLRKDYPLKGYQIFTDSQPVIPTLLE